MFCEMNMYRQTGTRTARLTEEKKMDWSVSLFNEKSCAQTMEELRGGDQR
jgi:hypothetical protein